MLRPLLAIASLLLLVAPAAAALGGPSCTSTSRCTGVEVAPDGNCTRVTVWYVDYPEEPTYTGTLCPFIVLP